MPIFQIWAYTKGTGYNVTLGKLQTNSKGVLWVNLVWTDSNGVGHGVNGNDRAAYANAAAQIQQQIDKGVTPDAAGRDILRKA